MQLTKQKSKARRNEMRDREKRKERLRVEVRRPSRINTSRLLSAFPYSFLCSRLLFLLSLYCYDISTMCALPITYSSHLFLSSQPIILTHPPNPPQTKSLHHPPSSSSSPLLLVLIFLTFLIFLIPSPLPSLLYPPRSLHPSFPRTHHIFRGFHTRKYCVNPGEGRFGGGREGERERGGGGGVGWGGG